MTDKLDIRLPRYLNGFYRHDKVRKKRMRKMEDRLVRFIRDIIRFYIVDRPDFNSVHLNDLINSDVQKMIHDMTILCFDMKMQSIESHLAWRLNIELQKLQRTNVEVTVSGLWSNGARPRLFIKNISK